VLSTRVSSGHPAPAYLGDEERVGGGVEVRGVSMQVEFESKV
jgi:hypothetical protein